MNMRKVLLSLCGLLLIIAGCSSQPEPQATEPAADNTARNANNPSAPTPPDQVESEADLQISANIRKAIVADDSLSTNAQNVKIITAGGIVTLRGPVKTQQEKATIESKAKQVAGVTQVNNLLELE
jgi:hyperosmotically inducible periplasmic protein